MNTNDIEIIEREERIRIAQALHAEEQRRAAAAIYRARESAARMRRNDYGITSRAAARAYFGD